MLKRGSMNVNYANKDEITHEIIQIQLREKIRTVDKKLNELQLEYERSSSPIILDEIKECENSRDQLLEKGADANYSRQKFGEIVILINDNLLKKPCFRNYSENWTEDFKSNAIYKIFKYINNFDPEKISKITGKKISSFAYLTQITYMAFIEVINKRKNDTHDLMENMIPLQDLKPEHYVYSKFANESTYYPDEHREDDTEYFIFPSVNTFVVDNLICDTLYDVLKTIRIKFDKVHVTYPSTYHISMTEFKDIDKLGFDRMSLVKQRDKIEEEIIEEDIDDEACFAFTDEEFEDWGEWTSESED
jgi:hypothetical protein